MASSLLRYTQSFEMIDHDEMMNNKTIYHIASLVMAVAMVLGATIPTQAAPSAQTTGPTIYWGTNLGKSPSNADMQGAFAAFETRSRKKMSIISFGQPWQMSNGSWGEFQTSYFDNVRNHGSIPMITWGSQRLGAGANQPNFQLRDIYGGTYDAYIRRWATAAKNWGHPFFLRFDHEMNGWWYPWGEGKTSTGAIVNGNSAGDFVKAWRHVHDIFISVGATNVSWVWAPNIIGNNDQYPALSALYPGDAYVNWTGLSVYNRYSTWLGLNPLLTGQGETWLRNSYNDVLTVAPNKPLMLAEWGSLEAGDGGAKKAAWIRDALVTQIPTNFPKIKAVVYFSRNMGDCNTCAIENSQAAIDAWAAGIGSEVYAANLYANLNTSPIPALAANTYTISGNAGTGGATLTYANEGAQFVTADGNGNYSITVPFGWNGTVTPYKIMLSFTPGSKTYTNIQSNQTSQNYTADNCPSCADKDTVGVFRPSNGLLYLKNLNITGFADVGINYGLPNDYPVVGDWDGNGTVTIGIYRKGTFYLRNSNTIGFADLVFAFGQPGDQPIAGDWNGDGVDSIGLYRPSTGQFLLRNTNSAGPEDMSFFLGNRGDVAIAGDWNGDGKDTTGVFRPANGIIFLKNTNQTGFADIALNYGIPGDQPVTGDWNNDGTDTIGVYRNGTFYLRNSNTNGFANIVFRLGITGDIPIAGNWDAEP